MTLVSPSLGADLARRATPRRYVMCPPRHFQLAYAINPYMRPGGRVDVGRAVAQWMNLRDVYRRLGHTVEEMEPLSGLPDMVFASNGAVVIGGRAVGSRYRYPEREGEAEAHRQWLTRAGVVGWRGGPIVPPPGEEVFLEGEGDVAVTGEALLLGTGFRSSPAAAGELAEAFGREVIVLELVDPRYYHLDVALTVLDDDTIAYHPEAFSPDSQALLSERFPDAVLVDAADAEAFALNAVSDGCHVILPSEATGFAAQLAAQGFQPIGVRMSELRLAGGGPKCCTLELRPSAR